MCRVAHHCIPQTSLRGQQRPDSHGGRGVWTNSSAGSSRHVTKARKWWAATDKTKEDFEGGGQAQLKADAKGKIEPSGYNRRFLALNEKTIH